MIVYFVAFFLTIAFANLAASHYRAWKALCVVQKGSVRCENERLKYFAFFLLAVLPFFLVGAVRYDVGTDYFYTYIPNFYKILEGDDSVYSEYGFVLLNKFIQLFTDNAQWLIAVTSLIYAAILVSTIVKHSESITVSLVVLLLSCIYFASLNNVRQAIAVVIVFAAFPHIEKGHFGKFCLYILCALLFHFSAIIMFIPYFVINVKHLRRHFIAFCVVMTLMLPLLCKATEIALMNTKYAYYFQSDFNNGRATTVNIIYHLFFFLYACCFCYRERLTNKRAYLFLVMQFFAFWVSACSLFIRISEMIMRTVLFFQIFQLLLIPHCFAMQKTKEQKFVVLGVYVVLYTIYMVYYIILKNYHAVLPYRWVF